MTTIVLFVENGAFGGGSVESLYQLLCELDRKVFAPVVVSTSRIPAMVRIAGLGVPTIRLEHWYISRQDTLLGRTVARIASAAVNYGALVFPRAALILERAFTKTLRDRAIGAIRAWGVDIVHANNNPHRDLWMIEAAGTAGVPCVSHLRSFHGFGFSGHRARLANASVSAYIAYSRSIAGYWEGIGLDHARVRIVPNAIGLISANPASLKTAFGISDSCPAIGLIGRIIPERGHIYLLKALPRLLAEFPDLKLIIVGGGDGEDWRSVKQLVETLGVDASVVLAGHRSDAKEIIAALDAIVLPYTIEPFGRTLLEAWQIGIPAILSRVGHIGDVVSDEEDGMLFNPGDVNDLADKISRVLRDPALRERLVANGKQSCAERFSIASQWKSIEGIYREVLSSDEPGREPVRPGKGSPARPLPDQKG